MNVITPGKKSFITSKLLRQIFILFQKSFEIFFPLTVKQQIIRIPVFISFINAGFPVTIVNVSESKKDNANVLNWEIDNEICLGHYGLEKSADFKIFLPWQC